MSKAADIARRLSEDFAELASQLEEDYRNMMTKLSDAENKTLANEQTLKDAAHLILERLK